MVLGADSRQHAVEAAVRSVMPLTPFTVPRLPAPRPEAAAARPGLCRRALFKGALSLNATRAAFLDINRGKRPSKALVRMQCIKKIPRLRARVKKTGWAELSRCASYWRSCSVDWRRCDDDAFSLSVDARAHRAR